MFYNNLIVFALAVLISLIVDLSYQVITGSEMSSLINFIIFIIASLVGEGIYHLFVRSKKQVKYEK